MYKKLILDTYNIALFTLFFLICCNFTTIKKVDFIGFLKNLDLFSIFNMFFKLFNH